MPEIKPLEVIKIRALSVQVEGQNLIITESDLRGNRVVKRYEREQVRLLVDGLIQAHANAQEAGEEGLAGYQVEEVPVA